MLHVYLFCIALSAGWALVRTGLADGSPPVRTARRPPSITAPAAAFGLAGLAAQSLGAGTAVQLCAAGALGLVAALASSSFRRASVQPQAEDPVARVTVGIPEGGVGEITWLSGPDRGTALARAVDGAPLPRGADVRVVAIDAGGVLVARTSGTLIPLRARERAAGR